MTDITGPKQWEGPLNGALPPQKRLISVWKKHLSDQLLDFVYFEEKVLHIYLCLKYMFTVTV